VYLQAREIKRKMLDCCQWHNVGAKFCEHQSVGKTLEREIYTYLHNTYIHTVGARHEGVVSLASRGAGSLW
jgi:hypothetical protein